MVRKWQLVKPRNTSPIPCAAPAHSNSWLSAMKTQTRTQSTASAPPSWTNWRDDLFELNLGWPRLFGFPQAFKFGRREQRKLDHRKSYNSNLHPDKPSLGVGFSQFFSRRMRLLLFVLFVRFLPADMNWPQSLLLVQVGFHIRHM